MEDLTMKLSLIELHDLVGDNMGVSFLYDELPDTVVTIEFTKLGETPLTKEQDEDEQPIKH